MGIECDAYIVCFYYHGQGVTLRIHAISNPSKREIQIMLEPLFS